MSWLKNSRSTDLRNCKKMGDVQLYLTIASLLVFIFFLPSLALDSGIEQKPRFSCVIEDFPEGRSNIEFRDRLWKDARVPYEFDPSFGPEAREIFNHAISQFNERTCIRWVPRQQETNYVHVFTEYNRPDLCGYAHACDRRTKQSLAISPPCTDLYTIVHEMLHTMCFVHEHERNDRDDFLTFQGCPDIPPPWPRQINEGGLYDYWSAVSGQCGGSNCSGYPTMPDVKYCGPDVNRAGLSVMDADKLNTFYKCQTRCHTHRWYNLQNLTSDDVRWEHLLNLASPGEEPIYVCRAHGVEGEISTGLFRQQDQACLLTDWTYVRTITKHIQVLAMPQDARTLTPTSRPYYWASFIPKDEELRKLFVTVGMEKHSKVIYLATRTETEANGEKRTLVGKLRHQWPLAEFTDTRTMRRGWSKEFLVLACQ